MRETFCDPSEEREREIEDVKSISSFTKLFLVLCHASRFRGPERSQVLEGRYVLKGNRGKHQPQTLVSKR
jgi:hypothetical protein